MNKPSWIGYKLSGRYELEALLGQGGMSTVYRGQDPNLRRPVAVKLIHPHLANNPEFVRRFEEEAAAVARLRHPHIVQVYDFNHDQETYYMVLEYVEGMTLEDKLAGLGREGRRMPLADVRRVMGEMIAAVGYAHSQSIVHRDLKPANIMVRPDGSTTLMDFGVVKMLGGEQHTATGAVMGTISYMAPEQIKGLRTDHRADLYALGVILYELAAGQRPFMGENSASTMMMHLTQPVPDLRVVRSEMAEGAADLGVLAEVVQRAMAKEPEARFQTAEEMLAALHATRQTTTFPPTPPPAEPTYEPTVFMAAPLTQTGTVEPTQSTPLPAPSPQPAPPPQPAPTSYTLWVGGGLAAVVALLLLAFWLGRGQPIDLEASLSGTATAEQTLRLALDRDQDGLTNAEELALGTDPDNPDTDGDGLSDGYEARIPCLDPLNPDSDGDGIPDGEDDDPCTPAVSPLQVRITAIRLVRVAGGTVSPPEYADEETEAIPGEAPASDPQATVRYEISFETIGFVPEPASVPGSHHLHFYFNHLPETEGGLPGNGPWTIYSGSSPFVDANNTPLSRPSSATQLCVAIANANHTLVRNSSQCFDLPAPDAQPD